MDSAQTAERPAFLKPEDGVLLTSHEADYMVENLRIFDIEQVGDADWMAQHEIIEKLNLQAHYNTMTHSDDFVMGIRFPEPNHKILGFEELKEMLSKREMNCRR